MSCPPSENSADVDLLERSVPNLSHTTPPNRVSLPLPTPSPTLSDQGRLSSYTTGPVSPHCRAGTHLRAAGNQVVGTGLYTARRRSCILSPFVLVQWSHRERCWFMVYWEDHSHVVSESKTSLPMPMQSPASRQRLQSIHVWCTGERSRQHLVHLGVGKGTGSWWRNEEEQS